jgi:Domain of unknown function (DUF4365)
MDLRASTTKGPRFTAEMRISQRAIFQLADRFTEAWWKVESTSIHPDTGEDMVVEIFDRGECAGLSLYLQVKGTEDIGRFCAKCDAEHLHYPVEVRHLEGWEQKTRPVALIVWDIRERRGYWVLPKAVCKELDGRSPGWRGKERVTILIPKRNTTDDEGLSWLRTAVALDELPKLARPDEEIPFELSLRFDESEAARAKEREIADLFEGGGEVKLKREYISEFAMSHDRLRVAFGEHFWRSVDVQLSSVPSKKSAPVRVTAESRVGVAELRYVELRRVRAGRRYMTISNEHQRTSVGLKLILDDAEQEHVQLGMELRLEDEDVYDARDAIRFVLTAVEPDAILRIERLDEGIDPCMLPLRLSVTDEERRALQSRRELMDRLCFLQDRVRKHGMFSLVSPLPRGLDRAMAELLRIVSGSTHEVTSRAKLRVDGAMEMDLSVGPGEEISFVKDEERKIELLGVRVPVGPARLTVADVPRFVETYNQALKQARATGRECFELQNILCMARYLDWDPEGRAEDRLEDIAKEQAGYFTADQAHAAGCFADYLNYLERRGKVETIAEGVLRLSKFPPMSDVEDLVVVWLQSGKKGVVSHHTALALHQLSDILPSRIHLTVPPDWTSSVELPAHVVLHHGELNESEISWRDVVPVTSPLRTLRDCVIAGLDPDLFEQARRDGIERGLFSAEDVPRLDDAAA